MQFYANCHPARGIRRECGHTRLNNNRYIGVMPMKAHQYLKGLPLALLCVLPTAVAAQEPGLDARLDAQEERIRQLESERYQTSRQELPVRVSGFINAGAQSTNLGKDGPTYLGTDNEVRYSNFTSAGLQFDATLSDRVGGTVQLLSEGAEDFATEAEWAYLSYEFTPSLKGRAGRIVAPFYMHSQYFHVGYAYPWIEPPAEVYQTLPIRTYEGVDLTWQFSTGDIAHSLNVYHGSTAVDSAIGDTDITYSLHNLVGVNLTSTLGNFTTWLGYSSADVDLDLAQIDPEDPDGVGGPFPNPPAGALAPYSLENDHGYFGSAGFQYDNGNLAIMGEHIELGIDTDWFPTTEADYVLVGYRFGNWMPHVTWAQNEDQGYKDIEGSPSEVALQTALYDSVKTHQKSWTFGVRGDVASNLAVKLEVSEYYDLGSREDGRTGGNGAFSGNAPLPDDEDSPRVFRAAVNLVF